MNKNLRYVFLVVLLLLILSCQSVTSTPTPGTGENTNPTAPTQEAIPVSKFSQRLQEAKAFISGKNFRQDYVVLIDFSVHSSKVRFFLVNLSSGKTESYHVAHGRESDPGFTGYATSFSNTPGSNKTAIGYYKTAETYTGAHGLSLKLDGLSSTNSNARSRAIVIHAADYVYEKDQKAGRSLGCPALAPEVAKRLVPLLKNGVLIYAYN